MHETLDETKTITENFALHGLDYTDDRVGGIIQLYGFEFFDREKKIKSLSG